MAPSIRTLVLIAVAAVALGAVEAPGAEARTTDTTVAREVTQPVSQRKTFELPITASHMAVHWRGQSSAEVSAAVSRDGEKFGPARPIELDEVSEGRDTRETYGAVTPAPGVKAVRISTDRQLERVTVLASRDRGPMRTRSPASDDSTTTGPSSGADAASADSVDTASVAQPSVVPRAGWGADESLRFDAQGKETWPPAFYPTQKLVVHHTAGRNSDPDPQATIRSIYYYHAITQGWGDIGYNFLIDESGRLYEGRYSREYAAGESPTGEDLQGNGVTAAHADGYNSGTTGIALLGTLTDQDATASARGALADLLAWEADHHGIDPEGSALYTNPVNGTQATFPNIAGHRDVGATECPGGTFYATLPQLRREVASRISGGSSTVKSYRPDGYRLAAGAVYSRRGAVSRLYNDDGSRVEITGAKQNGTYVSEIHPHASITSDERASLRKLTLDYDGNASGASTATTLRIYNFRAGTWEQIDGPRTGVTSDRSFTWSNASSPTDYVSGSGEVRVGVKGTRSKSFQTRTDLVRFTIEY